MFVTNIGRSHIAHDSFWQHNLEWPGGSNEKLSPSDAKPARQQTTRVPAASEFFFCRQKYMNKASFILILAC